MPIKYPRTQAVDSKTFTPPHQLLESDTSTIVDFYEFNAKHNSAYPLFRYWDGMQIQDITWGEMGKAIRRTAQLVKSLVSPHENDAAQKPTVVGILAVSDSTTYACMILGTIYAGYIPFLISTRNNAAAVTHLLTRTRTHHLFMSRDPTIQCLGKAGIEGLERQSVMIYPMPLFDDLFPTGTDVKDVEFDPVRAEPNSDLLILHSSGSTAFPKAVSWSQRSMVATALVPWFGEVDLCGLVFAIHSAPMFHGMGMTQLGTACSTGMILAVYKPQFPPVIPTPDNLWEGVLKTKSDLISAVPVFVQSWAKDIAKVAYLAKMKAIGYGGGPLSQEVGDYLAREGVKLVSLYGLTEVGMLNTFIPKDPGLDWAYFTLPGSINVSFVPYGDGLWELVARGGNIVSPRSFNTKIDGVDAYATSDLLVPHPTKSGMWKVVGRADDQIVLSNGEKTNPAPLENILLEDPHIQAVVMFGRGKFQVGILVDPKPEYGFDPQDPALLEKFRNLIWPSVKRMNELAPQHGRLFKEMILVASPSKPFQYTAKMTPRRHVVVKMYADEIEALYDAVDRTTQGDIEAPPSWTSEATRDFVRANVTSVLGTKVPDDADIFQHGCDSLQATWIRNTILRGLRGPHPEVFKSLPVNIVYQAPSVNGLVDTILASIHDSTNPEGTDRSEHLLRVVDKYSANFPTRPASLRDPGIGDVVLVTGTTSGMGCDTLAHLLADESVARVYALNRRLPNVSERQQSNSRDRGLDENLLHSSKFCSVEGDASVPGFDIDPALFQEIRDSITHIIHNAWRVDFNLSLISFEANLKATRNLVDLALASPHKDPPRLLFVSSIGMFKKWTAQLALEEPLNDPNIAAGQGYTESKWVAEQVLLRAAKETDLRPVVVRVGQIAGDRRGHWNEREWLPALIKSAVLQGSLPDIPGQTITWIPSYEASRALIEMRNSPEPVLHLAHPHPVPWTSIIKLFAQEMGHPLVPYHEWVSALHGKLLEGQLLDVEQMRQNPALRLLDFFRNADTSPGKEAIGLAPLSVAKAVKVAPSLNSIPQLGLDNVRMWLDGWRSSSFLPSRNCVQI